MEVGKLYNVKLKECAEQIFYCLVLFENWKIGLKDPNYPLGSEWIKTVTKDQIESFTIISKLDEVKGEKLRDRVRVFLPKENM